MSSFFLVMARLTGMQVYTKDIRQAGTRGNIVAAICQAYTDLHTECCLWQIGPLARGSELEWDEGGGDSCDGLTLFSNVTVEFSTDSEDGWDGDRFVLYFSELFDGPKSGYVFCRIHDTVDLPNHPTYTSNCTITRPSG